MSSSAAAPPLEAMCVRSCAQTLYICDLRATLPVQLASASTLLDTGVTAVPRIHLPVRHWQGSRIGHCYTCAGRELAPQDPPKTQRRKGDRQRQFPAAARHIRSLPIRSAAVHRADHGSHASSKTAPIRRVAHSHSATVSLHPHIPLSGDLQYARPGKSHTTPPRSSGPSAALSARDPGSVVAASPRPSRSRLLPLEHALLPRHLLGDKRQILIPLLVEIVHVHPERTCLQGQACHDQRTGVLATARGTGEARQRVCTPSGKRDNSSQVKSRERQEGRGWRGRQAEGGGGEKKASTYRFQTN